MFELFDPKADVRIQAGSSLPHWYQAGVSYFVTFRTEDSIPADVSRRWYAQRANWLLQNGIPPDDPRWRDRLWQLPETARRQFHDTFSRQYLEALDKGLGACVLRRQELNNLVGDSLRHFDGDRYHLGDFVVMPNHVHLIACLLGDTEIEAQCASWKRFTARQINQKLGTSGRFWQEESFDHLIRSREQFEAIQRYIRDNPAHLPQGDYLLYQPKVAGTLRVPSAEVHGSEQRCGTRSVPTTPGP
jgi:type I restriction enzyme R subunit